MFSGIAPGMPRAFQCLLEQKTVPQCGTMRKTSGNSARFRTTFAEQRIVPHRSAWHVGRFSSVSHKMWSELRVIFSLLIYWFELKNQCLLVAVFLIRINGLLWAKKSSTSCYSWNGISDVWIQMKTLMKWMVFNSASRLLSLERWLFQFGSARKNWESNWESNHS